jgi:hypothetical protein
MVKGSDFKVLYAALTGFLGGGQSCVHLDVDLLLQSSFCCHHTLYSVVILIVTAGWFETAVTVVTPFKHIRLQAFTFCVVC